MLNSAKLVRRRLEFRKKSARPRMKRSDGNANERRPLRSVYSGL